VTAPQRLKELRSLAPSQLCEALLNDGSDVVRHEAAFLLGEQKSGLHNLIEAAGDRSILVRHEVALALANFPASEVLNQLLLMHEDAAKEVRSSADYAIQQLMLQSTGQKLEALTADRDNCLHSLRRMGLELREHKRALIESRKRKSKRKRRIL